MATTRRARLKKAVKHNEKAEVRKTFLLTYHKLNGRVVKRRVAPLKLNKNLLIGYDYKRKDIRSYRVERIKRMKKAAFWVGFEKQAGIGPVLRHGADLAGLGALAYPSIQEARGKHVSDSTKRKTELGGLGLLAASTASSLTEHLRGK